MIKTCLGPKIKSGAVLSLPSPCWLHRIVVAPTGGVPAACAGKLWGLRAVMGRVVESTRVREEWSIIPGGPGGANTLTPDPSGPRGWSWPHSWHLQGNTRSWANDLFADKIYWQKRGVKSGKTNRIGHYFAGMDFSWWPPTVRNEQTQRTEIITTMNCIYDEPTTCQALTELKTLYSLS